MHFAKDNIVNLFFSQNQLMDEVNDYIKKPEDKRKSRKIYHKLWQPLEK
ncbi:hypothetical protein [Candidatus Uabimicrobium sp. HlEnr_7]